MDIISWMEKISSELGERPAIFEGKGVKIENGAAGASISAAATETQAAAQPASSQAFPFKAAKGADANSVLIMGNNESKGRGFSNLVTLGLSVFEVPETTIGEISSDSWIYLCITHSGGSYGLELKTASSLPEQSVSEYNIPIAFVHTKDGEIAKISQLQYGPIQGAGRIF